MGAFGHGNAGDEAILETVVAYLYRRFPAPEIAVFTADPAGAEARLSRLGMPVHASGALDAYVRDRQTEVENDFWRVDPRRTLAGWLGQDPPWLRAAVRSAGSDEQLREIGGILRSARVLHVAGGGYLNTRWPNASANVLLAAELARQAGCAVHLTGHSLGPCAGHYYYLRSILRRVRSLDLRDPGEAEWLRRRRVPFTLTADDCLLGLGETGPLPPREPWTINLCLQQDSEFDCARLRSMLTLLDSALGVITRDEPRLRLRFLCFCGGWNGDVHLARALSLPNLEIVDVSGWSRGDLARACATAACAIGTRFHFALFSLMGRVPVLSLSMDGYYHQKLAGALSLFGSEGPFWPEALTPEKIRMFIWKCLRAQPLTWPDTALQAAAAKAQVLERIYGTS